MCINLILQIALILKLENDKCQPVGIIYPAKLCEKRGRLKNCMQQHWDIKVLSLIRKGWNWLGAVKSKKAALLTSSWREAVCCSWSQGWQWRAGLRCGWAAARLEAAGSAGCRWARPAEVGEHRVGDKQRGRENQESRLKGHTEETQKNSQLS